MNDGDVLWDHITKHRDDWVARIVLADWMEESGDPVGARGQRWQVDNKRHPTREPAGYTWAETGSGPSNYHDAVWDCQFDNPPVRRWPPRFLPKRVYAASFHTGGSVTFRHWGKVFRHSEGVLAEGLERIRTGRVRFTNSDRVVVVASRKEQRECLHEWVAVDTVPSWRCLCIKCGRMKR